jgi:hypothetical protein
VIEIHKALGSIMGLMFCVWILSGVVLVFHNFPHASKENRFLHLPVFSQVHLDSILAPEPEWGTPVYLEMAGEYPVYRVPSGKRNEKVYNAYTLNAMPLFSAEYADSLCASYVGSNVKEIEELESLDQWVPWAYYHPLLPFYKCTMADDAHSEVYVSARSGSVLQRTTRKERLLAWLGIIPHKLYFYPLLKNRLAWKTTILSLAALGLFVSLSGVFMGFLRLMRVFKGRMTPFKKLYYKWHHLSGFIFGVFLFSFLLSGLFSVTGIPDWIVGVDHQYREPIKWKQTTETDTVARVTPGMVFSSLARQDGIRRIGWERVLDESRVNVWYEDYQRPEIYSLAKGKVELAGAKTQQEIISKARQLFPEISFSAKWQTGYDDYYFEKGMGFQPLPVCKLTFNDPSGTIIYIDSVTGDEVYRTTKNKRLRRWLYRSLHTFNFPFLMQYDWLRKTILIIVSIGALVIGFTGLVLGGKWSRRKLKRIKRNRKT